MAKIKFSISYEISEDQISKVVQENPNMFLDTDYQISRKIAINFLALLMFQSTLDSETLKSKDFKYKLDE